MSIMVRKIETNPWSDCLSCDASADTGVPIYEIFVRRDDTGNGHATLLCDVCLKELVADANFELVDGFREDG